MNNIKIFLSINDERSRDESKESGFRGDVNVEILGANYQLFVYDVNSFVQEIESEINTNNFYDFAPNMIIVPEVTNEYIIFTINKLYENGFFSKLVPQENKFYPKNIQIQ